MFPKYSIFSLPVRNGNTAASCGHILINSLTLLSFFFTSYPPTKVVPSVGFNKPHNMFIVVVFPAPLGPKSPKSSPLLT